MNNQILYSDYVYKCKAQLSKHNNNTKGKDLHWGLCTLLVTCSSFERLMSLRGIFWNLLAELSRSVALWWDASQVFQTQVMWLCLTSYCSPSGELPIPCSPFLAYIGVRRKEGKNKTEKTLELWHGNQNHKCNKSK